jgi:hypothetical protein
MISRCRSTPTTGQAQRFHKVQFETLGPLGILTLSNPPLNLLGGELIEDLRTAVSGVQRAPLRALLVRAADGVVDEVAPLLFQSEDMRAGVATLIEHGARNFLDKVTFHGR